MGLVIGILSQPLIRRLRSTYQGLMLTRQEIEIRIQCASASE